MRWLVVVCCLAAVICGGCGPATKTPVEASFAPTDTVKAAPSVDSASYVIEAGDFLLVTSASHPELDCVGRVSEDGTIPLKVIQYVRAAGSTTAQFAQTASELYAQEPGYAGGVADLNVEVKRGLYLITGQVTDGGFRPYKDGLTLHDAVMAGGKMRGDALKDRVHLNRKGADGREIIRYEKMDQLKELPLLESDWVVVPYRVEYILH